MLNITCLMKRNGKGEGLLLFLAHEDGKRLGLLFNFRTKDASWNEHNFVHSAL